MSMKIHSPYIQKLKLRILYSSMGWWDTISVKRKETLDHNQLLVIINYISFLNGRILWWTHVITKGIRICKAFTESYSVSHFIYKNKKDRGMNIFEGLAEGTMDSRLNVCFLSHFRLIKLHHNLHFFKISFIKKCHTVGHRLLTKSLWQDCSYILLP